VFLLPLNIHIEKESVTNKLRSTRFELV